MKKRSQPKKQRSQPLEFLARANEDPKLRKLVFAALEKGGLVTAQEVTAIAKEAGFSFTRTEFERDIKRSYADRFSAGELLLIEVLAKPKKPKLPPESSCAKGCLSWTVNFCPREFKVQL